MKTLTLPAIAGVFFALLASPAFADIGSIETAEVRYADDEMIKFQGQVTNGREGVNVIIRDPAGKYVGMLSDPVSNTDGSFETDARKVSDIFTTIGTYNATGFASSQVESAGIILFLEYDGSEVILLPDYTLDLEPILPKRVNEGKTLTFLVRVTGDSADDPVYGLDRNPPGGAEIDASTGKFVWTPSTLQGSINGAPYTFDITATKGVLIASERVTITVFEPPVPKPKPKPEPEPEPEPVIIKQALAEFVDEGVDPQTYVDRYNNEAGYKQWFNDNYSEYETIYEAVGLEAPPPVPAEFVDEGVDPQTYVDRYNNEAIYKKWFDDTYPEYATIYEAVGLDEPAIEPTTDTATGTPDSGECGIGTYLDDGVCVIAAQPKDDGGGGCLIATAAYGSELAPQVQLLREIRDDTLLSTQSGTSFMAGFNSVYYSFSPAIADLERQNPAFRQAVGLFVTPMLSSLSIMSLADEGSEPQVLGLGISVIALNLGMYIVAPAMVGIRIAAHLKSRGGS